MSSELPCISMNLRRRARYSSGIQSSVSTWPPDCTYFRNSCSRCSIGVLPTERSLGWKCNGGPADRATSPGPDGSRRRRGAQGARSPGCLGFGGPQRSDTSSRRRGGARGRRLGRCRREERARLLDLPPHAALEVAGRLGSFGGVYVDANAVAPATAAKVASLVG